MRLLLLATRLGNLWRECQLPGFPEEHEGKAAGRRWCCEGAGDIGEWSVCRGGRTPGNPLIEDVGI